MKYILLFIFLCFAFQYSCAQNSKRKITVKSLGKDSVRLSFNDEYYLIEDSCAQIFRYGRLNIQKGEFYGKFKDVSKSDTNMVVSEGNYTENGFKDGEFTSHYLNGKLRSKGKFKKDRYDGKWQLYYEDGTPELTFESIEGDCHIIDFWKPDGTQEVTNGNGVYIADIRTFYWKGKLLNGKPDGTWKLMNSEDISNTTMATEHFKNGQFRGGNDGKKDYNDNSQIVLVSRLKLPFLNAENLALSEVPCNGIKRKHIVNAQYANVLNDFAAVIGDAVSGYLSELRNIGGLRRTVVIEGEVSEKGGLVNMKNADGDPSNIGRGLLICLKNLPALHPATVDGKPVKQQIRIDFRFNNGFYQISYQLLPIEVDQ